MAERFRVLVVATHPVQYMAPIFRRMARHPRLDLQVAYCSLRGAEAFWIARKAAKKAGAAFLFGADATTLVPRDGRVWKKWIKRITWPILFGLAYQVVVPSSDTHDLMRSLGIPEERITLTPYSVDRSAERAKLGLREEEEQFYFARSFSHGSVRCADTLLACSVSAEDE